MRPPWLDGRAGALARIAIGHARRHRLQSALLVLGVALGVAVVVAIDLANGSALAAFELSTEAVTGRATHRVAGGRQGLDDEVYRRLRVELGVRAAAPVVEGQVRVAELGGEALTLLGVDPFAEPPFRGSSAPAMPPATRRRRRRWRRSSPGRARCSSPVTWPRAPASNPAIP